MCAGRPAKFNTVEELEAVIQKYFDKYNNKIKTITSFSKFLGFKSRQSYYDYLHYGEQINNLLKEAHKKINPVCNKAKYVYNLYESNGKFSQTLRCKERAILDPCYRLTRNIRTRINQSLKSKTQKTINCLPYTIEELKKHLESKFLSGMNWENYGDWHVDHIKPICSFNYKTNKDKSFKECWCLDNLQPLWAVDNLKKGGRIF